MSLAVSRRQVLKAGLALGAGVALGDLPPIRRASAAAPLPPTGVDAPFDHVVVCMMENRSFDHFLGWLGPLRGADGIQAGLQFTDLRGATYPTYNLAPDYEGCGYADPDHSWQGGAAEVNGGRMDGFLRSPGKTPGDTLPIGYYTQDTINVLGTLVQNYGTSDRYFCSILSATYPNRFYQHCGRTDRDTTGDSGTSTLPAIWDLLTPEATPGSTVPTGRYYSTDLPFTALFGAKYVNYTFPFTQFLADCASGGLPNVAFVDPEFLAEGQGFSRDDHPHADVRAGEFFMYTVYNAVRNSPAWDRTVLIFNYDEWGGFYDHVPPPRVAADDSAEALQARGVTTGMDTHQLGVRVPLAVVSPLVPKGTLVRGDPFEHSSVLKMILWRWGLQWGNPSPPRIDGARNLAEILDLQSPPRSDSVTLPTPTTTTTTPCGPTNSTPAPPPSVPEVPWVPGMTVAAAAAVAGWTAVRRHRAPVGAVAAVTED